MTELDPAADPAQAHNGLPVLVHVGPLVNGVIRLADGTQYNVTPAVVAVAPEHLDQVAHHHGQMLEAAGTFLTHDDQSGDGVPFRHKPCVVCREGGS